MAKVKSWLIKRDLIKDSQVEVPESIDSLLSGLESDTAFFLKNFLRSKVGDFKVIEKALKNPDDLIKEIESAPSSFHKTLAATEFLKSANTLIKSLYELSAYDLSKAIHDNDFRPVKLNHDISGETYIDSSSHLNQFPSHGLFSEAKNSLDRPGFSQVEGAAPKLVIPITHKTTSDGRRGEKLNTTHHLMIKPYFQKEDYSYNQLIPKTGWSTLATKALYNAGGIGDLAEDVTAGTHDNIPVTIHKFHPFAMPVGQSKVANLDSDQIHKMAVMDYLTDNLDRHQDNIMVYPVENGKHNILAIDHERSFNYRQTDPARPEHPLKYMDQLGYQRALEQSNNKDRTHKNLVKWWKDNGLKIKNEMANQVSSIKDEQVRNHIYKNFDTRWKTMDNWANQVRSKHFKGSDSDYLAHFEPHVNHEFKVKLNQKILNKLPKHPKDAISAIYDIVHRRRNAGQHTNHTQRAQLNAALTSVIDKMSPDEMADAYNSSLENPNWNDVNINSDGLNFLKNALKTLKDPKSFHDGKPEYKLNHIKALAEAIMSNPASKPIALKEAKELYSILGRNSQEVA